MGHPRIIGSHVAPLLILLVAATALQGCRRPDVPEDPSVQTYFQGRITVSPEIDPVPDYSGFEVVVTHATETGLDTLGYAVTDTSGAFQMDVRAPARGIYPFVIIRHATIVHADQFVIADGDSAVMNVELPLGSRPLLIRSRENSSWLAYSNTKALYDQAVFQLIRDGRYDAETLRQSVGQTAEILWSMRQNYGGTIGAEIAAAEAIFMLAGWNDSLVVERARQIEPDNVSYVDVARAARQAKARHAEPDSALHLLDTFIARTDDPEKLAGLYSERVLAHLDAADVEEAEREARELSRRFPESPWAGWAERVVYDFENLMPGMQAPDFAAVTVEGDSVTLEMLRGRVVLLEFYRPDDDIFRRELQARNALHAATPRDDFALVSISLQPDTTLNEAFFEGRDFPGTHVIEPGGQDGDLARLYNVYSVPTRLLIDRQGQVVSKYEGASITRLQGEVAVLLGDEVPPS
jgi:peroxiredoxin